MPTLRTISGLLIAAAIAFAGPASAQTPATPAAPAAAPSHQCEKPGDPPAVGSSEMGKAAQENRRNKWNAAMKTYIECLKKFVEQEQALASPHIKAANAGIAEYDKAIKIFNDSLDAYK